MLDAASHVGHPCRQVPRPTTRAVSLARFDGLTPPSFDGDLSAVVAPPLGWKPDPLKKADNHTHRVWVSADGDAAYGVIAFSLPFPVGPDLVLWGFLQNMRKSEGEATLVEKRPDPDLPGVRFVADGGRYRIRGNLVVDGFGGWVVYAGTLREKPVNFADLRQAQLARERTPSRSALITRLANQRCPF